MCGIVGLVGDFNAPEIEVFRKLLFLDTIRGDDSTGVASIGTHGSVKVVKRAVPGYEFIRYKEFNDEVTPSRVALIGHNRAATIGTITDDNAHPFQHKHIVGVHNGTLNHGFEGHLFENIQRRSFPVDSEHIYYAMSIEDEVEVLKRTHGSMALVWYNNKTHSINFIRNDKRPLYYVTDVNRKRMFFMSEPSMLVTALSETRGASFEPEKKIALFEENVLYTMALPKSFGQKLPEFERKGVVPGSVSKKYVLPPIAERKKYDDYLSIFNEPKHSNVINYTSAKQAHSAGPPKNSNPNSPVHLTPARRAAMSKAYWDKYAESSERRFENANYQKFLKDKARNLKHQEVIKEFCKYHRLTDELMSMFSELDTIPGFKEYEPLDSKRITDTMSAIDYVQDILNYWEESASKSAKQTVYHQVKERIKGWDPATLFVKEEAKPKLIIPDTIPTKEENTAELLPDLEQPSGLGNLSLQDFKNLVKNQGCDHCSAQDVNWEPTSCYLTVSRQLICPDCVTTENVQSLLNEGMIKLA